MRSAKCRCLCKRACYAFCRKKILRVGAIEPTRVDVRVIAATHRDLTERIARRLPSRPLLSTQDPAPGTAGVCATVAAGSAGTGCSPGRKIAVRTGIDITVDPRVQKLLDAAWNYEWPGNVRELEICWERDGDASPSDAALEESDMQLRELMPESTAVMPTQKLSLRLLPRVVPSRRSNDSARSRRKATAQALTPGRRRAPGDQSRTTLWRKLKKERLRPSAAIYFSRHFAFVQLVLRFGQRVYEQAAAAGADELEIFRLRQFAPLQSAAARISCGRPLESPTRCLSSSASAAAMVIWSGTFNAALREL